MTSRVTEVMRFRRLVIALLFVVGCAVLGLVLLRPIDEKSVTLAELAGAGRTAQLLGRPMWDDILDVGLLFYGVVGLCAFLLALRAVVSAVRLARMKRFAGIQNQARYDAPAGTNPAGAQRMFVADRLSEAPFERAMGPATPSFGGAAVQRRGAGSIASEIWANGKFFWRGFSGKMIFTFAAVVAAFGLLSMTAVYFTLTRSLTTHALKRATVLAANVSDGAPPYVLKKNAAGLRELLRKLANSPGVAYALVQDRSGGIFAHSFAVLPQEVQGTGAAGETTSGKPRILNLGGGQVYEVSVPLLEGRAGAARVALWKEEIDASIHATVMPIIQWMAMVIVAGILLTMFFAWRIASPILRLVRAAQRISRGELDAPSPGIAGTVEFAELSQALERLRSSVKAALIRLHPD